MNDEPMTIKNAGDSWNEAPGCRHRISANASKTEGAAIFATLVLETEKMDTLIEQGGPMGVVLIDEEYREAVQEQKNKLQAQR